MPLAALDRKEATELVYRPQMSWLVIFYGTTPKLKGFYLMANSISSGWSVYERLWLAK